jgi:hypothetical protein
MRLSKESAVNILKSRVVIDNTCVGSNVVLQVTRDPYPYTNKSGKQLYIINLKAHTIDMCNKAGELLAKGDYDGACGFNLTANVWADSSFIPTKGMSVKALIGTYTKDGSTRIVVESISEIATKAPGKTFDFSKFGNTVDQEEEVEQQEDESAPRLG